MIHNELRNGNFTSSKIVALTGINSKLATERKKALTYIEEKRIERIIKRSISTESDARPLQWGKLCEGLVFQDLTTEYDMKSKETVLHPTINYWAGSPDVRRYKGSEKVAVGEIKCPMTLKSYFSLAAPVLAGLTGYDAICAIRNGWEFEGFKYTAHPKGEEYYQQGVSNAILEGVTICDFIFFVPKQEQLEDIRAEAKFQGVNFITYSSDDELPYMPTDSPLPNKIIITCKIPQADIDALTSVVVKAGDLLIGQPVLEVAA